MRMSLIFPIGTQCYDPKPMSPRVQKLLDEVVELSSSERLALIKELVGSIDVRTEHMDRRLRAVLQLLDIPTANAGTADIDEVPPLDLLEQDAAEFAPRRDVLRTASEDDLR